MILKILKCILHRWESLRKNIAWRRHLSYYYVSFSDIRVIMFMHFWFRD